MPAPNFDAGNVLRKSYYRQEKEVMICGICLGFWTDNTLIYSYRHPIGDNKVLAELYEGREVLLYDKAVP